MATKMNQLLKEVKDITECPICTNMFNNPKMLPCFHTFCLKCIEQYGVDKIDGEALPCPMCRKEFKVPTGGFSELSANFFIDRLISVQAASGVPSVTDCDVCTHAGNQKKVVASSVCMTCRENLCDECCEIHKSTTMTMSHELSPIGGVSEFERRKLEANFCEEHPSEQIKFYCQSCKMPSCVTCSITNHNSHKISEIDDTAKEFKTGFRSFMEDVGTIAKNIREQSAKASEQAESFKHTIEQVENEIKIRSEDIITLVNRRLCHLLGELNVQKTVILKNIESQKEELQMNLLICDNFKQFCSKVDAEADSVEVVSVADELKTRAEELKALSIPELGDLPEIKFIPSDFDITKKQGNFVGTLSLQKDKDKDKDVYLNNPRFRGKMSQTSCVGGFTFLKDELYVASRKSPGINVYDNETLVHRRKFTVKGLVDAFDIIAHANVLYVSEYEDKLIHRIQLSDGTSSHWPVDSTWLTMSINKRGNIVVCCPDLIKIIEYTPIGSYVREIQVNAIDKTIFGLRHAIPLDYERFVICYSKTQLHRVCIIDSNGKIMKKYGVDPGYGIRQICLPVFLAIDQNGFILVADYYNNRIIQLNESLEFFREFIPESVGLEKPRKMRIHSKRIFISEFNERNIAIFDL